MARRRTVTLCRHTPDHGGARHKLWAFSRADLAALLGVSQATIRRREQRGELDPSDIEAICRAWARENWRSLAVEGLEHGAG